MTYWEIELFCWVVNKVKFCRRRTVNINSYISHQWLSLLWLPFHCFCRDFFVTVPVSSFPCIPQNENCWLTTHSANSLPAVIGWQPAKHHFNHQSAKLPQLLFLVEGCWLHLEVFTFSVCKFYLLWFCDKKITNIINSHVLWLYTNMITVIVFWLAIHIKLLTWG